MACTLERGAALPEVFRGRRRGEGCALTLILTYHAIEAGPPPLCLPPEVFAEHIRVIAESGLRTLTVQELGVELRGGTVPRDTVVITFDDGCASVAERARPLLAEQGLRATVFCVAGHLGGANDWRTQAPWAPRLRLADADALRDLTAAGWEIGSHGFAHEPLDRAGDDLVRREVVESRSLLEAAIGVEVTSFAWPYGARPTAAADAVIAETYVAACGLGPALLNPRSESLAMPRVDVHYLRDAGRLRRALAQDSVGYLALRLAASRVRRRLRPDYHRAGRP